MLTRLRSFPSLAQSGCLEYERENSVVDVGLTFRKAELPSSDQIFCAQSRTPL